MMITENNCEEYFLLYADNELNSAERNAVAAFIEQHPKYAAALEALLQTKLSDDENFVFNNKKMLYKNADAEIGINNYEDYFLLYTDNELSEADKENTERFVLQHPQLQAAFTLLQQAKLSPEKVVYPNKKELYKKERIATLSFGRMMSAAAVLVAVAFGWWLLPSAKQNDHQPVAITVKTGADQSKKTTQTPTEVTPLQVKKTESANKPMVKPAEQKQNVDERTAIAKKQETKRDSKVIEINLPDMPETNMQPPLQTALKQTELKPPVAIQTTALKPLEEVSNDENLETALSLSANDATAKPVVYKELNTEEDTHTLYVGSLQLNKAKVNGFLKSASHLFGSKNKQNAD